MKKPAKFAKLVLNKETVRALTTDSLVRIIGGSEAAGSEAANLISQSGDKQCG